MNRARYACARAGLAILASAAFFGCEDPGPSTLGEGGASAPGHGSEGGGGATGGESSPQVTRGCIASCATAADCADPASPLMREHNWTCSAGRCQYAGCHSDQECLEAYQKPGYLCEAGAGTTIASCVYACTTVADCADPASPLLGADNWSCTAGRCNYAGCNSTQECQDAHQSQNFVCAALPGSSLLGCLATCATVADCTDTANALFDADNWACGGGRCQYGGCNSTQECKDASQIPNAICE